MIPISGIVLSRFSELAVLTWGIGGHLLPGAAGAHALRPLGDDVRPRPRLAVAHLQQDPPPLVRANEREAAPQPGAVEDDREVAGIVALDLRRALVPDDHGAGAPRGAGVD